VDARQADGNLHEEIRRQAYQLYEQGGRQQGRELDDWLQSESEVMAKRKKGAIVA
jgi:hypothetical protein